MLAPIKTSMACQRNLSLSALGFAILTTTAGTLESMNRRNRSGVSVSLMSLIGTKQTCRSSHSMSALEGQADLAGTRLDV
jgi:hypothetical protein